MLQCGVEIVTGGALPLQSTEVVAAGEIPARGQLVVGEVADELIEHRDRFEELTFALIGAGNQEERAVSEFVARVLVEK